MRGFTHLVVQGPAVVRWSHDEKTGITRIAIDGTPDEHVVVEVHIDRLILEK